MRWQRMGMDPEEIARYKYVQEVEEEEKIEERDWRIESVERRGGSRKM